MKFSLVVLCLLAESATLGQEADSQTWQRRILAATRELQSGYYAAAGNELRQVVDEMVRSEARDFDLGIGLRQLGVARLCEGQPADAASLISRAVLLLERDGTHPLEVAIAYQALGSADFHQQRYTRAEHDFGRALSIQKTLNATPSRETVDLMSNLGAVYHLEHRLKEADEVLEQALILMRSSVNTPPILRISILDNLAVVLAEEGRHGEALGTYREALAVVDASEDPDGAAHVPLLHNYAVELTRQKKYSEALVLYARAVAQLAGKHTLPGAEVAQIIRDYGVCLRKAGQKAQARKLDTALAHEAGYSPENSAVDITRLRAETRGR
jgi:tetratricopeptide (TPR) repeat protein